MDSVELRDLIKVRRRVEERERERGEIKGEENMLLVHLYMCM